MKKTFEEIIGREENTGHQAKILSCGGDFRVLGKYRPKEISSVANISSVADIVVYSQVKQNEDLPSKHMLSLSCC